MHLLRLEDDGEYKLHTFYRDIPPYAVLSHRWTNDEPTYQDIKNGTGRTKLGYFKLNFCATRVQKDELEYFWVDTVCIDKSSSAELQEAINSMFSWYQKAQKCYVYLHDVETDPEIDALVKLRQRTVARSPWTTELSLYPTLIPEWYLEWLHIGRSEWFSRGWTLQELLAPKEVQFFSVSGVILGNKRSLSERISRATGIPAEVLQGKKALSEYGADVRMSWTKGRSTTRDEDSAYCLCGIFDVIIPVLYGEGRDRAFRRLNEEIRKLLEAQRAEQAANRRY